MLHYELKKKKGSSLYEELYQKLKEYKETTKRPIWDYMAHYAASGGYMVSMASDKSCLPKGSWPGIMASA